jgi:hypothetical protein
MTISGDQSLRRELGRDERLLWSGASAQGLRFRKTDWLLIPFTLLWCGFAMSILTNGHRHGDLSWLVPGVPFGLAGLYMVVGRFFADAYLRKRTEYAVTDQRVLIVNGFFTRQVKSLPLAAMNDITLSEGSNGMGSIQFGPSRPGSWMMLGTPWPGVSKSLPPMFDLIQNVRHVHDVIMKAQQSLRVTRAA